jgi:hypothetical protein
MLINNELAKNDYQALRQLEKEFFYFNSKNIRRIQQNKIALILFVNLHIVNRVCILTARLFG